LLAEAFNALNRNNRRVVITDDGFTSTGTDFTQIDKTIGIKHFPALLSPACQPVGSYASVRSTPDSAGRAIHFLMRMPDFLVHMKDGAVHPLTDKAV
jgi:hypothetical protein